MSVHHRILACLGVLVLAGPAPHLDGATSSHPDSPCAPQQSEQAAAADQLPVLRIHRYRMAGRIRPLLFWVGRDDVGMGEIVWRAAESAAAYELLIGTEPAKAPRGINRWGYILEDSRPAGTRILGVMTTSDEATLTDVTRRIDDKQRLGRFKGIDALIAGGISRSATETIETDREFTVRDKTEVVLRIRDRLKDAASRDVPVPAGVRPGFLTAVAELVGDSMAASKEGAPALRKLKGRKVGYVYGRKLYDLELTGLEPMGRRGAAGGRELPLHADFEITNRDTRAQYTFELEYATDGPLAGVPTLIRHQPRWWLQAVLTLEKPAAVPGGEGAARGARGPAAPR